MRDYPCENCGKIFKQKCHLVKHTENKKYPCVKKEENKIIAGVIGGCVGGGVGGGVGVKIGGNSCIGGGVGGSENIKTETEKKVFGCRFCLKCFSRSDSVKRHIEEERCEVLKLQKQQKENIFVNLLTEEKIISQTKKEIKNMSELEELSSEKIEQKGGLNNNQIDILMNQIKQLNEKLEEQKRESENQKRVLEEQKRESEKEKKQLYETLKKQKRESEEYIESEIERREKQEKDRMKAKFEEQMKIEREKIETEHKLKLMSERYSEIEKNNLELKKINEKLQNKMNKIVNKNKITNTQNITNNTLINNNGQKLVDFGNEDLSKISHKVFIDTVKSQGAGLYNKALEGIHFNKEHPENQNIYISDINRGKVMIYKDEKWFLDNWENIYPRLLEKLIQFGYDKNEFMKECGYKIGGMKYNKDIIKNGMRWYKLLDGDESDIEYFEMDPEERPEIDEETYNDYLEMYNFRKRHQKKETEKHIKDKMKLNMYNKKSIPIENYKKIESESKKLLIENK